MIVEATMKAEAVEMKTQSSTAEDLLDECWFFKSVLITRETPSANDTCAKVESDAGADGGCGSQERVSSACRDRTPALQHRMPSFNACNPKLRHSLSSLENYRPSSSSKNALILSSSSMARDRPPPYIMLERSERYLAIQHYVAKEAYYRKIFKEKKWRSHSDLEYIELQGFKDLGFVFDKKELNASLAKVLPGLSDNCKEACNGEKFTAPPMFRCVDKRSAEDMKEQLMFWARAVACNARRES